MEDNTTTANQGIPGASEVPLLGNLFKSRNDTMGKSELIIFIKATIVNPDGSAHTRSTRAIYERYTTDTALRSSASRSKANHNADVPAGPTPVTPSGALTPVPLGAMPPQPVSPTTVLMRNRPPPRSPRHFMLSNIRYVLLTAMRDRLFLGLFVGILAAAYISSVLGSTAMLETKQMSLSFTAASSRVIIMVGVIVFIRLPYEERLRRARDRRAALPAPSRARRWCSPIGWASSSSPRCSSCRPSRW
ncbi:MAG: hypothetical protein WDN72_08240 [Alphaproteobacteria bacterium]